jgi:TatD DNase family protein
MFFDLHSHQIPKQGIFQHELGQDLPAAQHYSVGFHPRFLDEDWQSSLALMAQHFQDPYCIAIGECGLDALGPNINLQTEAFHHQLALAKSYQKPVILHGVKRWAEIMAVCKNYDIPKIVHGFNKHLALAEQLLQHNFHLSFGKSLLYKLSLQNVFRQMPLHRVFLETDDADTDIAQIYAQAAQIKQISIDDLQLQMTENLKIFDL